jgi:hypothetical protein
MVEAAIEMGDEVDTKVGLIREEFLQEGEVKAQDEEVYNLASAAVKSECS